MKPTFCLYYSLVFVVFYMNAGHASGIKSSSPLGSSVSERQKLPSIETIKNFFASIDESMIYKITNTIRLANLVAKLRKLFQIKQLKEDLQKRIEQTSGRKTVDKSIRLLALASNWPSILRFPKTNVNNNEEKIPTNEDSILQQTLNNHINYYNSGDKHNVNKDIESQHNIKL